MTFRPAHDAFDDAIRDGRLSPHETESNYVGKYMYMGTEGGHDLFKNTVTRRYLPTVEFDWDAYWHV